MTAETTTSELPSTSMTTVALGGERLHQMAKEMAKDMEGRRRDITRGGAVVVGVGVAVATIGACAVVGGVGVYLVAVAFIAVVLGISVSVAALALSTAAVEAFVRLHWSRLARSHGLDDDVAARALEEARDALYEEERARIEAVQARQKPRRGPATDW
jgi:hypothetical protein